MDGFWVRTMSMKVHRFLTGWSADLLSPKIISQSCLLLYDNLFHQCYQAKVGVGWKRSNGGSARGGWVGASLFIKAKFPHFYQHSLISPSPALLLFRHHVTCSMGIKNKRTASSVWYWGKFLGAIIPSTLVSQWPSDLLCEYFLNIELKACHSNSWQIFWKKTKSRVKYW